MVFLSLRRLRLLSGVIRRNLRLAEDLSQLSKSFNVWTCCESKQNTVCTYLFCGKSGELHLDLRAEEDTSRRSEKAFEPRYKEIKDEEWNGILVGGFLIDDKAGNTDPIVQGLNLSWKWERISKFFDSDHKS